MMRWLGGIMVWASMGAVAVLLVGCKQYTCNFNSFSLLLSVLGIIFAIRQYIYYDNLKPSNGMSIEDCNSAKTGLIIFAIFIIVILIIFVVVLFFLRKRIFMAIALIKEGSRYGILFVFNDLLQFKLIFK